MRYQTLECRHCGWENRILAAFCGGCGCPLPCVETCPACGARSPHGQSYCNACGALIALRALTGMDAEPAEIVLPAPSAALYPGAMPSPASSIRVALSPSLGGRFARIAVAVALAVALFARLYALGDIPPQLHTAEEAFRRAAIAVVDGGWIGFWSEMTDAQPTGLVYWMAGWIRLFGDAVPGLRLLSAAVGLATVGVFYLFCRLLFGTRAALLGSLLMALNAWHLTYSRLVLPVNWLLLVELVSLCLLYLAFSQGHTPARRRWLLLVGGITFGSGIYFHNAFFIFCAVVLLLWLREFMAGEYLMKVVFRRSLAFFVPALVVAIPGLVALAGDSAGEAAQVRDADALVLPANQGPRGVTERTRDVLANIARDTTALFWRGGGGDGEGQGPRRLLDPVTALLACLGLGVGACRWRERRHLFVWAILATTLVAVALTREQGMYGRLAVAMPAVFASAGYGFHGLLVLMRGRVPLAATKWIIVILMTVVASLNLVALFTRPVERDEVLWATHDRPACVDTAVSVSTYPFEGEWG